MTTPTIWCTWTHTPVDQCPDHADGHPHGDLASALGRRDEPQRAGALVVVWPGDYRHQEVWAASGMDTGVWRALGGEYGRPEVWEPPQWNAFSREPRPPRPAGTVPRRPSWEDVLTRGPVFLLTHDNSTAYRTGWRNGRRNLYERIETLAEEDE